MHDSIVHMYEVDVSTNKSNHVYSQYSRYINHNYLIQKEKLIIPTEDFRTNIKFYFSSLEDTHCIL